MHISLQNINNNNYYKPSFKSMGFTVGRYKDSLGVNRETQNTTGVRTDINLKDFANITKRSE